MTVFDGETFPEEIVFHAMIACMRLIHRARPELDGWGIVCALAEIGLCPHYEDAKLGLVDAGIVVPIKRLSRIIEIEGWERRSRPRRGRPAR